MSATADHDRAAPPAPSPTAKHAGFLPEVQALRTVAVLLVVVYHLWPGYLPGGYIGVDVFFVISGYLITAHIVREVAERGTFTLHGFYVRRIRRLLPAALLVLAVVGVVTFLFAPQTMWNDTGKQIAASALYVENWALVANSVDYLGAAVDSSPVQHFWSLSVEEQFYLVWPVMIVGVWALLGLRRARSTAMIGWVVVAVGVLSLALSVFATASDQPTAYFNTFTRVWEFALGGALAVFAARLRWRPWQAVLAGWAGFAAILYAAIAYSSASPFPGWIAIVPTLGTALVIAAGHPEGRLSLSPIMRWRPVQFLGDISYSIYLWHWPLIVLAPIVFQQVLNTPFRIGILLASIALGWASKRFVEDPFRTARVPRVERTGSSAGRPVSRSVPVFAAAAAGMLVVAGIGAAQWGVSEVRIVQAEAALEALPDLDTQPCFGAAAVDAPGCTARPSTQVVPDPIIAKQSTSATGCQQSSGAVEVLTCSFGSDDPGAVRVALAGDSHAGQWLAPLRKLADQNGWHLDTYLRSGCGLAKLTVTGIGGLQRCASWNEQALDDIVTGGYDVVLVSTRSSVVGGGAKPADQQRTDAETMAAAWSEIAASGARVVAIRDIPQPANGGVFDTPTCVLENPDVSRCATTEEASIVADPQVAAAEEAGDVDLVDLADYFCRDGSCPAVIGGVLVYGDGNHMTGLYATTLAPFLDARLRDVLGDVLGPAATAAEQAGGLAPGAM